MKEKIDRQLAGQSSLTPFMSMGDNFNKKVTFDKLTLMMGKLVTEDKRQNKPFKS